MPKPSRSMQLLEKSIHVVISAFEIDIATDFVELVSIDRLFGGWLGGGDLGL